MLDSINIEKEPQKVNYNFSRKKIEQLDEDIICVKKSEKRGGRENKKNRKIFRKE